MPKIEGPVWYTIDYHLHSFTYWLFEWGNPSVNQHREKDIWNCLKIGYSQFQWMIFAFSQNKITVGILYFKTNGDKPICDQNRELFGQQQIVEHSQTPILTPNIFVTNLSN